MHIELHMYIYIYNIIYHISHIYPIYIPHGPNIISLRCSLPVGGQPGMANLCGLWLAPAGSQRSAGPEEVADGRYQGVPWPWGIPQARWMVDPGKSHENMDDDWG